MSDTIVLQSHRQPLPALWLEDCIDSVKHWSNVNQFDYNFIGDELFEYLSEALLAKTQHQLVVATDLARLNLLQHFLNQGYKTVIWCDADFLIFSPKIFQLPNTTYALGREVWIQKDNNNSNNLVAKKKVHNAFMMFRHNNVFLDFYTETAERLITLNTGNIPPQFIGPKLLTAIHNIAQCPVLENAGMLSPLVIKDIANGGGQALKLFNKNSTQTIAAANLCASLYQRDEITEYEMSHCISHLLANKD